jgi:RHS repeat-associated protein
MPPARPDRQQSEVRTAVVVQTPELLVHDLDGNLVRDGRWMYSWDAENRLVRVMSWGNVDRRRVDWTYDALGRRVRQVRYVWTNSTWQGVEDLKLVSDPVWFGRHIAELNGTNHVLVRSCVWGLDLSETLDGAGGVGGLLWVRLSGGAAAGVHFVTYDGNGNVWTLVSAGTGTETARYEYGPFGEPLRLTGAAAGLNPFRFSTKRMEDGTGLVLYEYRAYSPALGRWLSRDPIGWESLQAPVITLRRKARADLADYAFSRNTAVGAVDILGLATVRLVLTTEILLPDPEPGMKTLHYVELDDKCTIIDWDRDVGVTEWPIPMEGFADLQAVPGGRPPVCKVTFTGTAISAYFAAGAIAAHLAGASGIPLSLILGNLRIDYNMTVTLNWCTRKGRLEGKHDGYPSYFLLVDSSWIYFHHQATITGPFGVNLGILKLLPPMDVSVDRRFKW